MDDQIFENVDNYISKLLGKEDKDLQDATHLINLNEIPNASISPNQGKFLQVLALTCNAKRILELGEYFGVNCTTQFGVNCTT